MNTFRKLALTTLFVSMAAPALAGEKTIGESVDDTWIHTRLNAALLGHESRNINVDVRMGEVLLAGFVNDKSTREEAFEIANSIKGVTAVKNYLYVRDTERMPGETLDDNIIAGKIEAGLAENENTSAMAIDVEVHEGTVLLSGYVRSEKEETTAKRLAATIDGVNDVIDGLEIASSS